MKRKSEVLTSKDDTSSVSKFRAARIIGRRVYDAQLKIDVDHALEGIWNDMADRAAHGFTDFEYELKNLTIERDMYDATLLAAFDYRQHVLETIHGRLVGISKSAEAQDLGLDVQDTEADGFWIHWTMAGPAFTFPPVHSY